jgi:hypothetical protein
MSADLTEVVHLHDDLDALRKASTAMQLLGATWLRATRIEKLHDTIILEGWRERPEDDGPVPNDLPPGTA